MVLIYIKILTNKIKKKYIQIYKNFINQDFVQIFKNSIFNIKLF